MSILFKKQKDKISTTKNRPQKGIPELSLTKKQQARYNFHKLTHPTHE